MFITGPNDNQQEAQLPQRYRAMRETATQGRSRSSVVLYDFLLAVNINFYLPPFLRYHA